MLEDFDGGFGSSLAQLGERKKLENLQNKKREIREK